MYFQTRILFVSFAATVILAIFIIPILRKFKIGQIERDDGPESHLGKKGTPTMGGIIMIVAIIIATVGACIFFSVTNNQELIKRLIPLLIIHSVSYSSPELSFTILAQLTTWDNPATSPSQAANAYISRSTSYPRR